LAGEVTQIELISLKCIFKYFRRLYAVLFLCIYTQTAEIMWSSLWFWYQLDYLLGRTWCHI